MKFYLWWLNKIGGLFDVLGTDLSSVKKWSWYQIFLIACDVRCCCFKPHNFRFAIQLFNCDFYLYFVNYNVMEVFPCIFMSKYKIKQFSKFNLTSNQWKHFQLSLRSELSMNEYNIKKRCINISLNAQYSGVKGFVDLLVKFV